MDYSTNLLRRNFNNTSLSTYYLLHATYYILLLRSTSFFLLTTYNLILSTCYLYLVLSTYNCYLLLATCYILPTYFSLVTTFYLLLFFTRYSYPKWKILSGTELPVGVAGARAVTINNVAYLFGKVYF